MYLNISHFYICLTLLVFILFLKWGNRLINKINYKYILFVPRFNVVFNKIAVFIFRLCF